MRQKSSQEKMPFDKRQWLRRVAAIERLTEDATGLSKGRTKCVRRFLKFVFKHKKSSAEGDITFTQARSPSSGQFSLSDELDVSERTIQNYLAWARSAGLVDYAVDCDGNRDRRTTLSFNWGRITELVEPKKESDNRKRFPVAQPETVSRQPETVSSATGNGFRFTNTISPDKPKSPLGGRDFGDLKEAVRQLGVNDTSCIDRAIGDGVSPGEIEAVLDHARNAETVPLPGVIFGRIQSLASKPKLGLAPWPHQVDQANEQRSRDAAHYRKKRQRCSEVRATGQTEFTDAIADVLCEDGKIMQRVEAMAAFEQLSDAEQDDFARSVLADFHFRMWRNGNRSLVIDNVLQSFAERKADSQNTDT